MRLLETISQRFLRMAYKRFIDEEAVIYRDIAKYIGKLDGAVVDLGGGPGYLVPTLSQLGAKYIIDVDIDFGMLRLGNYSFERVVADSSDIIFRPSSINYVIVNDALHHFYKPLESIRNYHSIISSCMYIIDIDRSKLLGKFIRLFEKILGFPGNFFAADELYDHLYNVGFSKVNLMDLSGPRYIVKACR